MAAAPLVSSHTASTAFAGGTSYEAVDVFTRASDQTAYVFETEYWNPFSSTSVLTTSSSSSTGSSTSTGASSTSSATNATQSVGSSTNSGISPGATAGIAIGCAAAGLILGAIAGFLFRRSKSEGSKSRYNVASYASQEKPLRSPYSTPMAMDKLQLEQFLLDSTPDAAISAEMGSLGQLIQQHVESCYHVLPVSRSEEALTTILIHLGLDQNSTMSAARLASLAVDPKTRFSAIQHVIARVTFASVTFNGVSHFSLLPQPISSFASQIPATESHRGNVEAVDTALTQWRQLSAFLLHPSRSDRTPLAPSEDICTHGAQQLAVALNTFLEPFVSGDRQDRYEQENHLREVIVECVAFGYLLFSQPCEYRYRFEGGVRPNYIVVFPGLDKVSDEEGHRYPSPVSSIVSPLTEMI
ncbi:uncharacterized protein GGS22DRAFT_79790 [Annulohypoxylon maeteangense]|uniref:uncharacterized protein n=1 Tax=Annulohypoxylon maeteangense TaxID=1927788 RepID=UPI002008BA80|nr:uncharacterized protein GGS22DRAFT_79790 [Annulohypoxylon maeteangense]KAI0880761.1 hypothetical protein GGS22DRAFT_79790 [Annulohypoxylon maeteangense]